MFVPMWIVWTVVAVVAVPFLYFGLLFLLMIIGIGNDALRQDAERARESSADTHP